MTNLPTTSTPYDPDEELRELLDEPLTESTVQYGDAREYETREGIEAMQRKYRVKLGEFELDGTETFSPAGVIVSLEGHLGFAASVLLSNALAYGVPTLCYVDDAPPPGSPWGDRYQDLTGEWYRPPAVDAGLPETRMQTRLDEFDDEQLDFEEVEEWARIWLSIDE